MIEYPNYPEDELCFDCLTEEDFDDPGTVDADLLLDDDDNLTAAGYDQLALLERKGFFS